ncbi:MAG: hypothetical protein CMB45_03760, partial [Euryarchaeota archaeon]|nr:hypothetical protein [Euryarchaeota archaeon]
MTYEPITRETKNVVVEPRGEPGRMLDRRQASDWVDKDAKSSTVIFPLKPTGPSKGSEYMSKSVVGSTD